ncbi:MAG: hypothetical protein JXB30_03325 [Anaerolineae bacterium]|nr:hypothetical protein [Anaerolineae bacterium]
MRKQSAIVSVLISLLALSSCMPAQDAQPEAQPSIDGTITVHRVRIEQTSITFTGETTLPDGTCIQTQLLADDSPVTWWPLETCVEAHNGAWEISVPFGVNDAPGEMDSSAQYVLHVWAQDAPSSTAWFSFDLSGPPIPDS